MVSLFCGAVVVDTCSMRVSHEQKIVIQHALALLYTSCFTEMFWHQITCQTLVYVFHGRFL